MEREVGDDNKQVCLSQVSLAIDSNIFRGQKITESFCQTKLVPDDDKRPPRRPPRTPSRPSRCKIGGKSETEKNSENP